MKLSAYKEDFYTFSGKASDVARTAAFAGIALIWVFKIDAKPVPRLPNELLLPASLFAIGLALDLLHYITAATIWGVFHRYHENKLLKPTDDPELSHSPWLARPINAISTLKQTSIMVGYGFLIKYIIGAWFSGGNP